MQFSLFIHVAWFSTSFFFYFSRTLRYPKLGVLSSRRNHKKGVSDHRTRIHFLLFTPPEHVDSLQPSIQNWLEAATCRSWGKFVDIKFHVKLSNVTVYDAAMLMELSSQCFQCCSMFSFQLLISLRILTVLSSDTMTKELDYVDFRISRTKALSNYSKVLMKKKTKTIHKHN